MIVGLGHYARTGKDEAALALVADGWQRVSFADPVRELTLATNPQIARLVNVGGWDQAKVHPTVVHVMEDIGRIIRRDFGPDAFIDAALRRITKLNVVVTDVRYPNEVQRLRELDAVLIKVERPGVGPSRPSDRHLIGYRGWDHHLENDGTVEQLHDRIRQIVSGHIPRPGGNT